MEAFPTDSRQRSIPGSRRRSSFASKTRTSTRSPGSPSRCSGVHLGQRDGDIREARALLGPSAQIGKTCHDSRHLAMEAGEAGADYVAFGAFYPTTTKPSDYRPDPSILTWWSTLFEIPCVAIGGITPDKAKPLVEAGADFLAVCQAVWGSDDPAAAVCAFDDVLRG